MEEFAKEAAMGLEGILRADDRLFVGSPEMVYLICVERTSGMIKAGESIMVDIRTTRIFRKEASQWRVVHHHADRF